MGNKITFDYSKAAGFVNEGEVKIMEKLAADAKETLPWMGKSSGGL